MNSTQNSGQFVKMPIIHNVSQIPALKLRRGQWIKLAWCDRPSRFLNVELAQDGRTVRYVGAIHFPRAATYFRRSA